MSNRAERRRAEKEQRRYARRGAMPSSTAGLTMMKAAPRDRPSDLLQCCALIDKDGVLHQGWKTHSDLRASIGREDPYRSDMSDTYGFMADGKFLTRAEAAALIGWDAQRELLSSDVW